MKKQLLLSTVLNLGLAGTAFAAEVDPAHTRYQPRADPCNNAALERFERQCLDVEFSHACLVSRMIDPG